MMKQGRVHRFANHAESLQGNLGVSDFRGTLSDIAAKVRDAKITLQALIMVGEAMDPALLHHVPTPANGVSSSHLYASDYTHLYRRAEAESSDVEEGSSGDGGE